MGKKRHRFPAYTSILGKGAQITGDICFAGGLHIDGKIVGDVTGQSAAGCGLTLGLGGIIEGDLDVSYVVIDGTVIGDVRASQRAELASGARIQGALYYGVLEMDEGAEVNGKLVHVDDMAQTRQPDQGETQAEEDVGAETTQDVAEGSVSPESAAKT